MPPAKEVLVLKAKKPALGRDSAQQSLAYLCEYRLPLFKSKVFWRSQMNGDISEYFQIIKTSEGLKKSQTLKWSFK